MSVCPFRIKDGRADLSRLVRCLEVKRHRRDHIRDLGPLVLSWAVEVRIRAVEVSTDQLHPPPPCSRPSHSSRSTNRREYRICRKVAHNFDPNCKNSEQTIAKALIGNYRDEHLFALGQAIELFEEYGNKINACDQKIAAALAVFEKKSDRANLK